MPLHVSTNSPGADEDDRRCAAVLNEAFAQFQAEMLGLLYFVVGNREDARDAMQETFVKCWRRRASLGEVENLRAWMFRVALNTGRDMRSSSWQRRRTSLGGNEAMLATKEPGAHAHAERAEELQRLRAAVHQLRHEEQEVFLLRQNAQMSYDEIAQTVGIPLGTVKTRMRLALGKLRLALAPSEAAAQ